RGPARGALPRGGCRGGARGRRRGGPRGAIRPRPRRVAAAEASRLAPSVRRAGLRGGLEAWDGQLVDDARLVVALARTAAAEGALVLTRVAAESISGDGATLTDTRTGESLSVRARAVVNATGVWADRLDPSIELRPSRGTHLVFDAAAFGGRAASLRGPGPGCVGRFVFALPAAHGRVYLGLTDEDAPGPVPDEPEPTEAEIDFLLDTVNPALRVPLTRADIRGRFAGLRPLLRTDDGSTADISREHAVLRSSNGAFTVVGGKLTTYRRMAEDVVDAVVAANGLPAAPCRTRALPLVGAVTGAARDRVPAPPLLVERYGSEATDVLALADSDPALAAPVAPGMDVLAAEFAFARARELALTEDDLLDRRSRIGLVAEDRAAALAAAETAIAAPRATGR
uniref:glycerol-3-phosphate dehydrogenase/oxidase n=1 Tax=Nocardia farcinica TaxID=37329 RepID=UPI003D7B105C